MDETSSIDFREAFAEIRRGGPSADTTRRAVNSMLAGSWSAPQSAGFLSALAVRGEDAQVVTAAARALRHGMVRVEHDFSVVLDTCGTGGDGSGTVNLSTGAAIICAALGVPVAKHGNRAVSGKAGSADVLEALGVRTDLPASAAVPLLREVGIAFLLAPTFHPAMRAVAPIRRELGIRTLFNILGPLLNPAGATHQLVGTYSDELRPVLAEALRLLGAARVWVVHGEDGLDEVTPYAMTRVTELVEGRLIERTIAPEDFGLERSPAGAALGGDAAANARIIEDVLAGKPHPARSALILNAAAALVVARGMVPRAAAEVAGWALLNGQAARCLAAWRAASRRHGDGGV